MPRIAGSSAADVSINMRNLHYQCRGLLGRGDQALLIKHNRRLFRAGTRQQDHNAKKLLRATCTKKGQVTAA